MNYTYVATIGFFDGVHVGHRYLISKVCEMARTRGLRSMVITFDRHPREVLQADYRPQLLTTPSVKEALLRQTGVDHVEVLHFTRELAALSAREFMDSVLRQKLHVCRLVIGYDHRFGHNRAEGFDDYVRYGRELGIEVIRNNEMKLQFRPVDSSAAPDAHTHDAAAAAPALAAHMHVSSTTIRRLLSDGHVDMAALVLNRHYTLLGHVAHGFAEGRKMGFPTANLDTTGYPLLMPAAGVYAVAVRVCSDDSQLDESCDASPITVTLDELPSVSRLAEGWMPAMLNIGTRPTFGGGATTVEAHILNFCGDIYGRPMAVAFYAKIRDEHRFDSIVALERQLAADRDAVQRHFAMFGMGK